MVFRNWTRHRHGLFSVRADHLEQAERNSEIRLDRSHKTLVIDLRMVHIITHCVARHFIGRKRRQQISQLRRLVIAVEPGIVRLRT